MSREAFEAWKECEGLIESVAPEASLSTDEWLSWALWKAALAWAYEDAARVCAKVSEQYQEREWLLFAEMKTDAQEGAAQCDYAIRERAKEVTR